MKKRQRQMKNVQVRVGMGGKGRGQRCPLVEVEWVDSCGSDRWGDGWWHEPSRCVSAGFMVRRTRAALHLVRSFSDNDDSEGRLVIPQGCVRRVRRVGVSRVVRAWRELG